MARHHPTHGGHRSASGGHELDSEAPLPGHSVDNKGIATASGFAKGGHVMDKEDTKPQVYNAQGSNEMDEAKDETPGFKKGGREKRKSGGMAMGEKAMDRMDRRPRRAAGGRTSGHNPYSSASSFTQAADREQARGYEGTPRKS